MLCVVHFTTFPHNRPGTPSKKTPSADAELKEQREHPRIYAVVPGKSREEKFRNYMHMTKHLTSGTKDVHIFESRARTSRDILQDGKGRR
jgi:hypothetical protein